MAVQAGGDRGLHPGSNGGSGKEILRLREFNEGKLMRLSEWAQ